MEYVQSFRKDNFNQGDVDLGIAAANGAALTAMNRQIGGDRRYVSSLR